jgi:hypothetical protein
MSLTSHLADPNSPITQHLHKRYRYITESMKRLHACMQFVTIMPPTRDTYPYWLIGQAIDYRIRFALELPTLRNLWAGRGIDYYAKHYLRDYLGEYNRKWEQSLNYFFTLESPAPQPLKHILDPKHERVLLRHCLILGHFEGYARSGKLKIRPRDTIEETLAIPWKDEVEDLYNLTQGFYKTCDSWFSKPVVCNPLFPNGDLIGGADGDLIIDDCLFDLKCSKKTRPLTMWLYQIIGYVLLDTDRTFTSCGFYFPRHNYLTQWKSLPWFQHLTRDKSLTIEREQEHFMQIIHNARQHQ